MQQLHIQPCNGILIIHQVLDEFYLSYCNIIRETLTIIPGFPTREIILLIPCFRIICMLVSRFHHCHQMNLPSSQASAEASLTCSASSASLRGTYMSPQEFIRPKMIPLQRKLARQTIQPREPPSRGFSSTGWESQSQGDFILCKRKKMNAITSGLPYDRGQME